MRTFAKDLDALIRKYTAKAKHGDDFEPIARALHDAVERINEQADRLRWSNETIAEFNERRALPPALTRQWQRLRTWSRKLAPGSSRTARRKVQ